MGRILLLEMCLCQVDRDGEICAVPRVQPCCIMWLESLLSFSKMGSEARLDVFYYLVFVPWELDMLLQHFKCIVF